MSSSNPSETIKAYAAALTCVTALRCIEDIDTQTATDTLKATVPTCQHPICWESYKGIIEIIKYCNNLHNSKEFATLQKRLEQINQNVETVINLHKYRN
jgi:hypothetical protein